MAYAIALAVVVLAIWGIVKSLSGDRYSKMTEEEFEAEAKRASLIGAGVIGLQKIIDPSHRVEYVMEEKQRAEADGAESGDRPDTGSTASPDEAGRK